jgi:hypothetical protein
MRSFVRTEDETHGKGVRRDRPDEAQRTRDLSDDSDGDDVGVAVRAARRPEIRGRVDADEKTEDLPHEYVDALEPEDRRQ